MTLIACPRWLPQFRIPFHFDAVWLALSLMDLVARPCYIFLSENDITFLHIFIQFKTCLDFESRWVRGRCWSCLVNDVNLFIASIITWLQDFKLFQNGFQHEWKWLAAFLVSFPGNMFEQQQQHCSWPILTTYSANDMTFEPFATGLDELLDWIQLKLIDFWTKTTFDLFATAVDEQSNWIQLKYFWFCGAERVVGENVIEYIALPHWLLEAFHFSVKTINHKHVGLHIAASLWLFGEQQQQQRRDPDLRPCYFCREIPLPLTERKKRKAINLFISFLQVTGTRLFSNAACVFDRKVGRSRCCTKKSWSKPLLVNVTEVV